jgi:large subunit ribosomal protein L3
MSVGLVGRKLGMSRVFAEDGQSIPVTVVAADPNKITQIKTQATDGYVAIQVAAGTKRASRLDKATAGHLAKANVETAAKLIEFRLEDAELAQFNLGDSITVENFQPGQFVDVTGISKGKGFAGTVKRHNFRTQDMTHGNSRSHRVPGSIGQNQSPGRVFKGKKMSGQMGNKQCTVQSQTIVQIDVERNLLLIRGAIPGAPGGFVVIKPSVKQDS